MSQVAKLAKAFDTFIKGCKADGTWNSIKASCVMAGWDGLDGALTPLVGTAPTNNNFVSGDYDRETGLVGDGTSKYLDTNRANNADLQNDNHNAVYVTTLGISIAFSCINAVNVNGANHIGLLNFRSRNISPVTASMQTGFNGHRRSQSSEVQHRVGGVSSLYSVTSQQPTTDNLALLRSDVSYGTHRIAFYSIGEALDLEALDTRVSTLMTDIAAAIP